MTCCVQANYWISFSSKIRYTQTVFVYGQKYRLELGLSWLSFSSWNENELRGIVEKQSCLICLISELRIEVITIRSGISKGILAEGIIGPKRIVRIESHALWWMNPNICNVWEYPSVLSQTLEADHYLLKYAIKPTNCLGVLECSQFIHKNQMHSLLTDPWSSQADNIQDRKHLLPSTSSKIILHILAWKFNAEIPFV